MPSATSNSQHSAPGSPRDHVRKVPQRPRAAVEGRNTPPATIAQRFQHSTRFRARTSRPAKTVSAPTPEKASASPPRRWPSNLTRPMPPIPPPRHPRQIPIPKPIPKPRPKTRARTPPSHPDPALLLGPNTQKSTTPPKTAIPPKKTANTPPRKPRAPKSGPPLHHPARRHLSSLPESPTVPPNLAISLTRPP